MRGEVVSVFSSTSLAASVPRDRAVLPRSAVPVTRSASQVKDLLTRGTQSCARQGLRGFGAR